MSLQRRAASGGKTSDFSQQINSSRDNGRGGGRAEIMAKHNTTFVLDDMNRKFIKRHEER